MLEELQILTKEYIVSIRDVQKNPSRMLRGITRIMRNGKTYGFFLDTKYMEDLIENMKEMHSANYFKSIKRARNDAKKRNTVSLHTIMQEYDIQGGNHKQRKK